MGRPWDQSAHLFSSKPARCCRLPLCRKGQGAGTRQKWSETRWPSVCNRHIPHPYHITPSFYWIESGGLVSRAAITSAPCRYEQEEQNENDQKHDCPACIPTECSIHQESPPRFDTEQYGICQRVVSTDVHGHYFFKRYPSMISRSRQLLCYILYWIKK